MQITKHASERQTTRLGLHGKKAKNSNAKKAYSHGIGQADCTGSFKRYLDGLFFYNHAGHIRVYNRNVYIFRKDGTFITVFPLPKKYHNTEDKIKARRTM
jgi:N-acetylneuraminic acid mutarotase